jgi:hypothetical protein
MLICKLVQKTGSIILLGGQNEHHDPGESLSIFQCCR